MKIIEYSFDVSREKLLQPFTFKGGSFTEKWLTTSTIESDIGYRISALGSMAILWSDPNVFSRHSETGGNLIMAILAEKALTMIKGQSFESPIEAVNAILEPLHEYGKKVSGNPDLRRTFILNSLISLDNALWKLFAVENGIKTFDELMGENYRRTFNARHRYLSCIPLVTYTFPIDKVQALVQEGYFFLKIKIGQKGSQQEMLEADKERLFQIFETTKDSLTEHSDCGQVVYYLDANGRYQEMDTIKELLEYCQKIGMLERILILEEPFPETVDFDVSDLPVCVAADESLHGVEDVEKKIEQGYGAMTLKPAGKTLSLSFEMGHAALKQNVPCYVADSACVPLLVDWNKNVAARLPALPGLKCGCFESNGAQFYTRWQEMLQAHPHYGAEWLETKEGMFTLDDDFYTSGGGIFHNS